jgi:hypothetical protein
MDAPFGSLGADGTSVAGERPFPGTAGTGAAGPLTPERRDLRPKRETAGAGHPPFAIRSGKSRDQMEAQAMMREASVRLS